MKYFYLQFLFIFCYFSLSCTNKKIAIYSSKIDYIEFVCSLSDDSRKDQLKKDADYLTALLSEASDLEIGYGFSFSVSNDSYSPNTDSVQGFMLPSTETIINEFSQLKNVTAKQEYGLPYSQFTFESDNDFKNINDRSINYIVKKAFVKNNTFEQDELKLQQADSILVKASYAFPVAFDTLIINMDATDSVTYKGHSLRIKKLKGDFIRLEYPSDLLILGYRAVNKYDKLIKSESDFGYPIYGLNPYVAEQIKLMISTINSAAQLNDKEACKAELETIPDINFIMKLGLEKLRDLVEYLTPKKADDMIKPINQFRDRYNYILTPKKRSLELGFPQPFKRVLLYVASNIRTIESELVVTCDNKPDEKGKQKIFYDTKMGLYGISNQDLGVIISPKYLLMSQIDSLYFEDKSDENNSIYYFLNLKERKLEKLPNNIRPNFAIKNGLSAFSDKKDRLGVLLDNQKQILPYKYDRIGFFGNLLYGALYIDDSYTTIFDFYKFDGKKIDLPEISNIEESGNRMILHSNDEKYGLLNEDGELAIPFKYQWLAALNDNLYKFNPDEKSDLWGIIDANGKIIVTPQFLYIESFYEGLSLVEKESNYSLIDTKGQVVFNFPAGVYVTLKHEKGRDIYYKGDDGSKYTYKGELIKN